MREYLLIFEQQVDQFISSQYIELRAFFLNPSDLPPLVPTLITAIFVIAILATIFLLFISIHSVLIRLGLKKGVQHWGIIYDSVTKQPLDPAVVELRDAVGRRMGSAITDMDGRYGFSSQIPGIYTMTANKTHYIFPSQKLAGHTDDGIFTDLYFGEQMYFTKDQEVIIKNIPLDPVEFDWNEHEKRKEHLSHSYSRHFTFLKLSIHWSFITILIVTIAASFLVPASYRYVIYVPLGLFLCTNIIRAYLISPRPYGIVRDKKSGTPLPFATVNIFYALSASEPIKYGTKKCDNHGKYYCLVPKGRYFVTIEKWVPNQKNVNIFTSPPFVITNGILNNTFEV
ncbi:carboxypeptidase-like regulatory domain-containing protein [Candidatus Parcubacteria bacterium]|nr:carboxypeptidase-like regulatory domain-containing protein [Candidatus Parcubacteria bacterium]